MDLSKTLSNYDFMGKNSKGKDIYKRNGRYFRKENPNYIVQVPYWASFNTLKGTKEE